MRNSESSLMASKFTPKDSCTLKVNNCVARNTIGVKSLKLLMSNFSIHNPTLLLCSHPPSMSMQTMNHGVLRTSELKPLNALKDAKLVMNKLLSQPYARIGTLSLNHSRTPLIVQKDGL